jgi:hypothetical protein
MVTGATRVSGVGNFHEKRKNSALVFVLELLYCVGEGLVTSSFKEEVPARGRRRARRRAVVHAERRDEDELLQLFLDEGVPRARLGCIGPVLVGLLVGSCGQVS